ncbi:MAG: GNAT family N-acetyltransferase [Promethearchaeota archaeon]
MNHFINILKNPNQPEIEHAIEFNFYEFFRSMVNTELEDNQYEETEEFSRFSTGISFFFFNGVIDNHISSENPMKKIKENITFFKKRKVPFLWVIGPSSTPKKMGELLIKNGFILDKLQGMAYNLNILSTEREIVNKVEIIKIENMETLKLWNDIILMGFGFPKEVPSDFFYRAFSGILLNDKALASAFLAYYDGNPVASSLVLYKAGVAGIHNVTTLEEVRGKGIGTAITFASLNEAKKLGYETAVLHSTEMGLNMYKRMGFKKYCTIELFIWQKSIFKNYLRKLKRLVCGFF